MAYSGALASGHLSGVATLPINRQPLSETYGYNIDEGTVTYSLQFNNRPQTCATGVLSENISITKNRPTDVYASLTVLGRAAGPILSGHRNKNSIYSRYFYRSSCSTRNRMCRKRILKCRTNCSVQYNCR